MRLFIKILCVILFFYIISVQCEKKMPTVGVCILVRNKAHVLPFFFAGLVNQNYPKDRMIIKLHTDKSSDNSLDAVMKWHKEYGHLYKDVFLTDNKTPVDSQPDDEMFPAVWTEKRFTHVIKLREEALKFTIDHWCDYALMIDADVILTEPNALRTLVYRDLRIVAPMLESDSRYSNFWSAMNRELYYEWSPKYDSLVMKVSMGCFDVPMVHSAVLVSLQDDSIEKLSYDPHKIPGYTGPHDDIIAFAVSAQKNGIPMYVCNDMFYGYIISPLEETEDLKKDLCKLRNIKLDAIASSRLLEPLPKLAQFAPPPPEPSKFGCDEVFMINLDRRQERRRLMELSFEELGLTVKRIEAVDGSKLAPEQMKDIKFLPEYRDPYHDRKMKMGEVGCFLSHYKVWSEIVSKLLETSMVLEDDVRFGPYFRERFDLLMSELKTLEWDFVYLGRKSMTQSTEEEHVSSSLVVPGYSYWTVGYLISLEGARKLLAGRPLNKLLPVDEYIPIMFDRHVKEEWKKHFPERGLRALAASPSLLEPAVYLHQEGYISDTEDSHTIDARDSPTTDNEDSRTHDAENSPPIDTKDSCTIDTENSPPLDTKDSHTVIDNDIEQSV